MVFLSCSGKKNSKDYITAQARSSVTCGLRDPQPQNTLEKSENWIFSVGWTFSPQNGRRPGSVSARCAKVLDERTAGMRVSVRFQNTKDHRTSPTGSPVTTRRDLDDPIPPHRGPDYLKTFIIKLIRSWSRIKCKTSGIKFLDPPSSQVRTENTTNYRN